MNASQSELLMLEQLRTRMNVLFRLMFSGCGIVLTGTSCGGDDAVVPTDQGTIMVAATTVGAAPDLDPNGYTVELSTGEKTPMPLAGTIYLEDLEEGDYQVGLTGIAANCAAAENPVNVSVVAADTVEAEFVVTCDVLDAPDDGGDGEPIPKT
jgi:hypothetical protein